MRGPVDRKHGHLFTPHVDRRVPEGIRAKSPCADPQGVLEKTEYSRGVKVTVHGKPEHNKCLLDHSTGEITCTNLEKPPRGAKGPLDCRRRWCPGFKQMHVARIKNARAQLARKGDVASLSLLATVVKTT